MADTNEVKFYLEKRKDTKSGKLIEINVPVFLFYSFHGQRLQYYTGYRIDRKLWDEINMKVKKNYSESADINRELVRLKAKVEELHDKAKVNGEMPTLDYFRENLKGALQNTKNYKTVWEAYREYIKILKITKADKTVTNAQTNYNCLEDFTRARHYRLTFERINQDFYNEFLDYCYNDKDYYNNYVGTHIRRLKAFLNWATEKGYHTNTEFKKKEFRKPYENTEIIYLKYDELQTLLKLKLTGEEKEIRDMYCLGATTGMRHSDIVSLKEENFHEEQLVLRTIKTREPNIIPLNPISKKILKQNKNKYSPYLMPQHTVSEVSEILKRVMKKAKLNRKVQIIHFKGSKRFEESQALWQCATFHTSKKTFVTNFLERGGSLTVAMAITGNRSYQSARRYFKIADTLRSKEMAKAFGK